MSLTNKDIDEIVEMRHLARTDLYFLSRVVLGYKKIDPLVHGPVIDHLTSFQHHQGKDHVSLTSAWKYEPLAQDPIDVLDDQYRRRLILDPRSWFKTTINCVSHTVQWIINFPDIEVFVVHGNIDLSQDIVGKILDHFVNNPRMRRLFPEFCAPIDMKTHRIKQNSLGTKSEFSVACKARKLGSPADRDWETKWSRIFLTISWDKSMLP